MADYPKFQISKFLDSQRQYQIVIRTDSYEELQEAMKDAKKLVRDVIPPEAKAGAKDVMMDKLPEQIQCPEHGERMYLRDGKFGPYYSHKQGDSWCNLDAKKYLKG